MTDSAAVAKSVVEATDWNERVATIRRIPDQFGGTDRPGVYAAVAQSYYVGQLQPDFGYIPWRDEYELQPLLRAYELAASGTKGFVEVNVDQIEAVITYSPTTLRIFRLLLALTTTEFAESTLAVAGQFGTAAVSKATIASIELGRKPSANSARACATVIDSVMRGQLFPPGTGTVRSKVEKPDTAQGWESVQAFATSGVPLAVLLHQRLYGGAFRQLLDATSSIRGNVLESAVQELFTREYIPFVRTGSNNQAEIQKRFHITVHPAPDFVVFDERAVLRAMLECKLASDGGTARDKAGRFESLRTEGIRLGGVPVFAVLSGIGWRRANDALGPVIRDTDGRVFSLGTLDENARGGAILVTGRTREATMTTCEVRTPGSARGRTGPGLFAR